MTGVDDIISVFSRLFSASHHTVLVGGANEPLYEPAKDAEPARIIFKEDFVASALHELAHWCIAGAERRKQVDYGYWYVPDRSGEAQSRFEEAEATPQAMEWVLSVAAGVPFRVSVDNVGAPLASSCHFRHQVRSAVMDRLECGLGLRARRLADELATLPQGAPDYLDEKYYTELPAI